MAEPRLFYLGVDGGATRTRAFLCDASGSRRARWRLPHGSSRLVRR